MREVDLRVPRHEVPRLGEIIPAVEIREIKATPALINWMETMGQNKKDITLVINSTGGEVDDLFEMKDEVDRIRGAYNVKLRTIVRGKAYSAAAYLVSWGDERLSYPSARFYLHHPQVIFEWENGRKKKDFGEVRKSVLDMRRQERIMEKWLIKATGKPIKELLSHYDRHLTAHEALEIGLIDRIILFNARERTQAN